MRKYKRAIVKHRMKMMGYKKICKKRGYGSFFSEDWRNEKWKPWSRLYCTA